MTAPGTDPASDGQQTSDGQHAFEGQNAFEGQHAFEGQCAFAVSTGKLGVEGSPRHRLESNGRTYLFKNGAARFLWRVLPGRDEKADEVWSRRSQQP